MLEVYCMRTEGESKCGNLMPRLFEDHVQFLTHSSLQVYLSLRRYVAATRYLSYKASATIVSKITLVTLRTWAYCLQHLEKFGTDYILSVASATTLLFIVQVLCTARDIYAMRYFDVCVCVCVQICRWRTAEITRAKFEDRSRASWRP